MELFGEVAAFAGLPLVVYVGEDGADEADHGRLVREDPDHPGSPLDLLVHPLERVGGPHLRPVAAGKLVNASTSALASSISGPILGNVRLSCSRTVSQVAATVCRSGWVFSQLDSPASFCAEVTRSKGRAIVR
jgi:hypothetical protein